jgi:hypothetical protein
MFDAGLLVAAQRPFRTRPAEQHDGGRQENSGARQINPAGGRDHWPQCWTMLMGGGPIKAAPWWDLPTEIGGAPRGSPVTPAQIAATVYRGLGIDIQQELPGVQGRPIPLVDRGTEPIGELFA